MVMQRPISKCFLQDEFWVCKLSTDTKIYDVIKGDTKDIMF